MKNKTISWTYCQTKPKRDFIDPRLPIARHIGWQKIAGSTTYYTVPEPDNYNRAVVTKKPEDCPFIDDQVIYKDINKGMWVTVLLVPDEQVEDYNDWLRFIQPFAYWQHLSAPAMRARTESLL